MNPPWKVVVVGNTVDEPNAAMPFAYTLGVYPLYGTFELWMCNTAETGERIGLDMMGYILNEIALQDPFPEPGSGHGFQAGENGEVHIEVTLGAAVPGMRETLGAFGISPDCPLVACAFEVRPATGEQ